VDVFKGQVTLLSVDKPLSSNTGLLFLSVEWVSFCDDKLL